MGDKTALKLWLQLAKTSAALQAQVNARFRAQYGQSLARFDVLSQLARAPGQCLNVGVLSKMLIASPGNISRLLDRMQSEALLHRLPSKTDRRSTLIKITPKGSALFTEMAANHARWVEELLDGHGQKQLQDLHGGLMKLQHTLGVATT